MDYKLLVLPHCMLAINENGEVVEKRFFESAEEASEVLKHKTLKEIYETEEVKKFIEELKNKGYSVVPANMSDFIAFREKFREFAAEKFNEKEYYEYLNEFSLLLSKKRIATIPRRDKLIIQVSSAIADLDKILNLMSERLREWYGLHFPELEIDNHEKYAKEIAEKGRRENFEKYKFSIGMELTEEDEKAVKEFAQKVYELYKLREKLSIYLEKLVKEEMPNLYALLGHVLAARLLAAAGSLEKLAKMPSSTIQLLGAEKALFRFLRSKGKTKPPKHGIIFLSPYISRAPKKKRGKIARLLAAKLMVAARMDYYTKENRGEELKKELEEKVKEVLEEK